MTSDVLIAPTAADLDKLLELAKSATANERPRILQQLAQGLISADLFTVSIYASLAQANRLCTAAEFKSAVKQAAKHQAATPQFEVPVPTDDELAQLWREEHPQTAHGIGEWRKYTDGVWQAMPDAIIKKEIATILEEAKAVRIRPTARLLSSVQEFARINTTVPDDKWDADPDILVCTNGTLHIPTRKLRPHNPSDYATTGVPFPFDSSADAPNFKRAINFLIPESASFVQEYCGLCLTTDMKFEMALWFYGLPGGGTECVKQLRQQMLEFRVESNGLNRAAWLLSGSKAVDLWTTLRLAPSCPQGPQPGRRRAGSSDAAG